MKTASSIRGRGGLPIKMSELRAYFDRYVLVSQEKQVKLERLIGDHTYELDLDARVVRFSGTLEVPLQVLGTQSDNTLTWLWAWAEEQTEIPRDLVRSSLEMKDWGVKTNVPECTAPSVDLDRADGGMISLIASEICRASCYYRDPYEGGALFLLLFNRDIERQPSFIADELAHAFVDLISRYDFNHRKAFRSYLQMKKLPHSEHASFITAELETGEDVRANFEESGRIVSLNGKPLITDGA
jgi:hypothetical protein